MYVCAYAIYYIYSLKTPAIFLKTTKKQQPQQLQKKKKKFCSLEKLYDAIKGRHKYV